MPRQRSRSRSQPADTGFSLVELTIATGLMLVILAAVYQIFSATQQRSGYVEDRAVSLAEMRTAVNGLDKELRSATSVTAMSGTSLTFCTYLDPSSSTVSKVQYTVTSGTMTRKVGTGNAVPVLHRVSNTDLFRQQTGTTVIELVETHVEVIPKHAPDTVLVLESNTRLRNLKAGATC